MIFIVKGDTYLGVNGAPPRFESVPNGGTVAIGLLDDETMKPVEGHPIEIYGDFQESAYLQRIHDLLQPCRKSDLPDFQVIVTRWADDNPGLSCPFFQYCTDICEECIVNTWVEEARDENA